MKDTVQQVTASLQRIVRDRERELRELTQDPNNYRLAQALTDALLGNLTHLANYQAVLDGRGKRHNIEVVWRELEKQIKATFKQLTGRDYEPEVCRHARYRREGQ